MSTDHLFTLRVRLSSGRILTVHAFEGRAYYPYSSHTRLEIEAVLTAPGQRREQLWERGTDLGAMYVGIPGHEIIDGDYAKEAVLSCLALRPGDTDADFFAEYTPAQLDFVSTYGEELSMVVSDRYGES